MILFPIWQWVYIPPVLLFLIHGRERIVFFPIWQVLYTTLVILFLILRGGEDNIFLNISGDVHHPCDIFPNFQGEKG